MIKAWLEQQKAAPKQLNKLQARIYIIDERVMSKRIIVEQSSVKLNVLQAVYT